MLDLKCDSQLYHTNKKSSFIHYSENKNVLLKFKLPGKDEPSMALTTWHTSIQPVTNLLSVSFFQSLFLVINGLKKKIKNDVQLSCWAQVPSIIVSCQLYKYRIQSCDTFNQSHCAYFVKSNTNSYVYI